MPSEKMSNEELRALIDEEARISEAAAYDDSDADAPLPAHVKVSRPGWASAKVLKVRLNPDEFEALAVIAADRDLPLSTIAREQLLRLIEHEKAGSGAVGRRRRSPADYEAMAREIEAGEHIPIGLVETGRRRTAADPGTSSQSNFPGAGKVVQTGSGQPLTRLLDGADAGAPPQNLNDWRATSAKLGGISRTLTFKLWTSGELKSVRIGSRRFSTDAQIDAYIAELEE